MSRPFLQTPCSVDACRSPATPTTFLKRPKSKSRLHSYFHTFGYSLHAGHFDACASENEAIDGVSELNQRPLNPPDSDVVSAETFHLFTLLVNVSWFRFGMTPRRVSDCQVRRR
jgi:hypothetical protein